MIIENIFTNFLAIDELPFEPEQIENICRARMDRYPVPNDDKQSFILSKRRNIDNIDEDIQPLLEVVTERLNNLHDHYGFSKNKKQEVVDSWINMNDRTVISEPHIHPHAFFSAVYYPKVTQGSTQLMFHTPINAHHYVIDSLKDVDEWNEFNSTARWINPFTGMLLIFPGWLHHYVKVSDPNKDRISVVFNSRIVSN